MSVPLRKFGARVLKPAEPTTLVVFGATGDLVKTKLFKAIVHLAGRGLLPSFRVVAFGRRQMTDESYRQFLIDAVSGLGFGDFNALLSRTYYVEGLFEDRAAYVRLGRKLKEIDEREFSRCSNKIFYLAVPPALYEVLIQQLAASGLTIPCGGELGWTRILIEKPFGSNLKSAERLDLLLGKSFKEEQIFRIDHYLAKESLQNILTFRFANLIFGPLWSRRFIERVRIDFFEERMVGSRGAFYDSLGALLDVGQNHSLAMLSLIAMERPASQLVKDIHAARARVINHLTLRRPFSFQTIVRGQYDGYRGEVGVSADSDSETYFSLETEIRNRRWRGVPFILRSGKALAESKVEISLIFKKNADGESNKLVFRIQPEEEIAIKFFARKAGLQGQGDQTEEKWLSFRPDEVSVGSPDAYERVLHDAILGDQTLFSSTAEVMAAWRFIGRVKKIWRKIPLRIYKKGSHPEDI
jgi:glucose-6-phosphate 1-dehydrogenase